MGQEVAGGDAGAEEGHAEDVAEFDVANLRKLPLRVVALAAIGSSPESETDRKSRIGGSGDGSARGGGGDAARAGAGDRGAVSGDGVGNGVVVFDGRVLRTREGLALSCKLHGSSTRVR